MSAPNLRQIAPSLYLLRLEGPAHLLNVYIWDEPDGVTLIDTGWASSARDIEAALHTVVRSRSDVRRIILTHFHNDHTGSASEIAAWGDVEVIAGRGDVAFIEGTQRGPIAALTSKEIALIGEVAEPPHGPACNVSRTVSDGDVLDFAGGARIIAVPGHTPGSIAVYLPEASAILTGDAVAELNGNVIVGIFNTDRDSAVRSLRALSATGAEAAGYGHGEPSLANAHQHIATALDLFADDPTGEDRA
ncbi:MULTISPECIES: MBL fold metallo-hydrolase [unclassified Rathayibacter]|uniref:MBL fold metallo-hydrolase n=1 Tax=unclassified Rathayibacter TaxID=2609250 RepID=UPI00188B850B|nr:MULTISPECIES: MBL fold metallo-hydrolase [unclassified Rathayibacter]MBF4463233.1 MBL fold metallo-hydrolase [Rathayibacter sp. VKM Ac-2879]MBF4504530.1 MBL fold metallo-hydrolase [Rathayibacter sp. VKM Ac-2878]